MATAFHLVNNNAEGVLNAAIDDNDLSAVLSSGQGAEFDTGKQYLTIGRNGSYAGEVLDVASRSSDTFTVTTRGVDGTTAVAHEAGDRVECLLVAAHITEIQDAINAIENGTVFLAQVKLGDDTGKLIFGADSDIQVFYDETTDDQLEFTDGTNLLAYLKDLGTTGLFGVTGRIECPQIGISADTDLIQLASGALSVNGTLDVSGHGAYGSAGTVTSTELLQVHESSTLTSGTLRWVYGRCIPAAASSASTLYNAIFGEIPYATAQSYTATLSAAVEGRITMGNVAATVARSHGVMATINRGTANPGTFTDYRAFFSQAINSSSAITTAYGLYLSKLGAGTTEYGLYVEALDAATTNYAIYTNAGRVRFGGPLILATITTFTANDTTPTVAAGNIFKVPGTWTAGNNITTFDDGVAGQEITIIGGDADCTIVDGSNLKMAGNWVANADATLVLVFDGTNWFEKCRSAN